MFCDDECCCFPQRGPQGFVGEPGSAGLAAGSKGPQGFQGGADASDLRGFVGTQGTQQEGPQGSLGPQGSDSKLEHGPQGPTGIPSDLGREGPHGFIGAQGETGSMGDALQGRQGPMTVGPQGPQGFPGAQGLPQQGAKGPQGFEHATSPTGSVTLTGFSGEIVNTTPAVFLTFPVLPVGDYVVQFVCIAQHSELGGPPSSPVVFNLQYNTGAAIQGGDRIVSVKNFREQSFVVPVLVTITPTNQSLRVVLSTASGSAAFGLMSITLLYIQLS